MALLRRSNNNPIVIAERELSELVSRRIALEGKLTEASAAVEAATNARRQSLLDADLSDEDASRRRGSAVHSARDQVEALADALRELGVRIDNAQIRLGEAREAVERRELAAAVRSEADALAKVREQFVAAS